MHWLAWAGWGVSVVRRRDLPAMQPLRKQEWVLQWPLLCLLGREDHSLLRVRQLLSQPCCGKWYVRWCVRHGERLLVQRAVICWTMQELRRVAIGLLLVVMWDWWPSLLLLLLQLRLSLLKQQIRASLLGQRWAVGVVAMLQGQLVPSLGCWVGVRCCWWVLLLRLVLVCASQPLHLAWRTESRQWEGRRGRL